MTVPPAAGPAGGWPLSDPMLRTLTAYALLGLAGVLVAFGVLGWILPPGQMGIVPRFSPDRFTQLPVLVGPLLAMLVATRLGPPLSSAPVIGLIALAEYAAALLFGGFGFLITLASRFERPGRGIYLLGGLLHHAGGILTILLLLVLLGLAGLWTARLYQSLGGRLPGLSPPANRQ